MGERTIIAITEAQVRVVRSALKDWIEEYGRTATEAKHIKEIMRQVSGTHTATERAAILTKATSIAKEPSHD
jgi:hypothetical protein